MPTTEWRGGTIAFQLSAERCLHVAVVTETTLHAISFAVRKKALFSSYLNNLFSTYIYIFIFYLHPEN